MNKIISLFLSAVLIVSGIAGLPATAFADECQHVWSKWEIFESPTCTHTGLKTRYCNLCFDEDEKVIPKTGHTWGKWETVKKSTAYKKGKAVRECEECLKLQYKELPKRKLTNNEKKAKQVVSNYLKAAKKYNVKAMNKCFASKKSSSGYPTKSIDWVYKKYNKKIDWKFTNITGKGKKYTVTAKVTRPNFYMQAYNAMYDSLDWGFNKWGFDLGKDKYINKTAKHFSNLYSKKIKASEKKTKTKDYKFTVIKKGKKWYIKSKTKTIVDIATASYNAAVDDAADDWANDLFDY